MKSFLPLSARTAKKRRNLKTRWPLLVLIVLLAGGAAAAWYFYQGTVAKAPTSVEAGTQAYTTAVKRGNLSISASGSGKLVAYQSVDLSFSTSGTLSTLNVQLGDMVEAGQELASLENSDTLEANLSAAKLKVINAQKTLTDLQENADLSLAQAYSDMVTAQETYATALKESQRMAYARCGQSAATQLMATLDRATTQLDSVKAETADSDVYIAAKQAYDTALANYNYCATRTSAEKNSATSDLDVARSALQDAKDQYETLKAASGIDPNELAMDEATLKEAQAQLAEAEDQLAGITLTAPIAGKVTYLAAEAGALVDTSKFITIVDVSHSMLEVSIDESDMSKLIVGASATVSFDALPSLSFTGTVTQVNPQVTSSGSYKIVKGLVELGSDAVKTVSALPLSVGATVTIVDEEVKDALLVPVVALKDLGDNTYGVMVKGSDGQMTLKVVTVGIQDSDYAEIRAGLNEGDLVSTGTVNFIAAGSSTSSESIKNAQNAGGPPGAPPGQ